MPSIPLRLAMAPAMLLLGALCPLAGASGCATNGFFRGSSELCFEFCQAATDTLRHHVQQKEFVDEARPDIELLIRADAKVFTERLVEIFGIASSVGIEKFGIEAQPPEDAR